jgi:hypothetical protein
VPVTTGLALVDTLVNGMMEGHGYRRRELMEAYEHPYRHMLAVTWRRRGGLRGESALAVAFWLVCVAGIAAGEEILWRVAGLGAVIATIGVLSWLVAVVRGAWKMTRSWGRKSPLGDVRARRVQAGEEDPGASHDEFAVTVEDDGHLVTWRFRPLLISEQPAESEIEVPGRPRYAASPVDRTPFEVHDTARASEQLVMAQTEAAQHEANAGASARAALEADAVNAELSGEARTTAAALRRVIGQPSRGD